MRAAGESGRKELYSAPRPCGGATGEESLTKSILAARKLVSYQLLAASIDRIICPVSSPGGSLLRPGNRVSKTGEDEREKQKGSERETVTEEESRMRWPMKRGQQRDKFCRRLL